MSDLIALVVTPTAPPPLPSPTAEDTPEPDVSVTPSLTGTSTIVPTFTFTPTLVRYGDSFDVPVDGTSVLPTLVLVPTATAGPQISFFSQPGTLIQSISVSSDILYWGYCDAPMYVDFEARVANNLRVVYVLLFLRLVDKEGGLSTDWGAGAIMKEERGGYYTYRITPEHLTHYRQFRNAWIQYQVVASTGGLKILGSSPVSENVLSLQRCVPGEEGE